MHKKAQCEPADPASETVTVRAREIEDSFAEIERQCDRKGLKVNESKTKILPIEITPQQKRKHGYKRLMARQSSQTKS